MEHRKTLHDNLRLLQIILHHIMDLRLLVDAIGHHVHMANTKVNELVSDSH